MMAEISDERWLRNTLRFGTVDGPLFPNLAKERMADDPGSGQGPPKARRAFLCPETDELAELTDKREPFSTSPDGYSSSSPLAGAAMPKKTRTARFSRTISSSARRPTRAPIFAFGTVVILSTINRQTARRPLLGLGSMGSRNRGASVGSVVNAHTVTESVMSKRSS